MNVSEIHLLWPGFLVLLACVPLLAAIYVWMQRRKRRYAVRFSSLELIRPALTKQSNLRRHIPPALFLLAMASLLIALARPTAIVDSISNRATIILAIDVSGSMQSDDIAPTRIKAAKSAALSFVKMQRPNTQVGIVIFSDNAQIVLPPTTDHDRLDSAIDTLSTGTNTAMGSGIYEALQAIADTGSITKPQVDPSQPNVLPRGKYAPQTIILLTDGYNTTGPAPLDAASQARSQGIRVFTIGFGAPWKPSQEQVGPPNEQQRIIPDTGRANRVTLGVDEVTLRAIADMTGGKFYESTSAGELENVFQGLSAILVQQSEAQEISVAFVALGALLAMAAIVLAMMWQPSY